MAYEWCAWRSHTLAKPLDPPLYPHCSDVCANACFCLCVCVCVWVCGSDKPRQSNSYSRACGNYVCRYVKWTWSWLHCAMQCDAVRRVALRCIAHSTIDSHVAPEAIIKFIAWKWAKLRGRVERQTGKLTNRQTDKLSVYLSASLAPPFCRRVQNGLRLCGELCKWSWELLPST